jgi:hypothetical protein
VTSVTKKATGRGLIGLLSCLILIGVFVIWVIEGIEPLGLEIVNSANASTTPDAALVGVNYDASKINPRAGRGGLRSGDEVTVSHFKSDGVTPL